MSVDFSTDSPLNSGSPARKPVDIQSLQETFAAILRTYGTEKGGAQTNSLLEIITLHDADNRDKNQQRREIQLSIERNDFTQIDRSRLDKSEIRSREMNSDYQGHIDRQKVLQNDYREKVERSELPYSTTQTDASSSHTSATSPEGKAKTIDSLSEENRLPQQDNTTGIVNTKSQAQSDTIIPTPNNVTNMGQANLVLPMNMNAPLSMPTPVSPQTAPPLAFTVFTPSGRFGQSQEKADEEDNDEEKPDEKKSSRKKQLPFAVFEAIRTETARPIQQNHARQPKEQMSKTEKPKEIETEQTRSVKMVEDLLHTVEQNITAQKKGEQQPDQTRYLHRIAAACEAAAHYAPIRMKINLDHLGTLALRFFYKAEKLTLRFDTPTVESAQFIRQHVEGLKTILSKRNIRIVDIEIING